MGVLQTGLSTQHKFTFATLQNHIYATNDWDDMLRWDGIGASMVNVGIAGAPTNWAPTPATAAGSSTAGKHNFRYRYKDNETGYVSNPSNLYEATIAAGAEQLTFTIAAAPTVEIARSTDTKVTTIILEATVVDGTEFYVAAEVAQTSGTIVFNLSDDSLVAAPLPYDDFGHDPPPLFEIVLAHKGRLIGAGKVVHETGTINVVNGSPNVVGVATDWKQAAVDRFLLVENDTTRYKIQSVGGATALTLENNYGGATANGVNYRIFSLASNVIWESLPLYPEAWPPLRFTRCMVNVNDRVRAMVRYHGDVLIMGTRNAERWSYTSSVIFDGQPYPVYGNRGALNQRVVQNVESTVYAFDRQGIWSWAGSNRPTHISHQIDPLLEDVDWDYDDDFHSVEIPVERLIRWYYVKSGDTLPKHFFEYSIDKQEWATGYHEMGITSSATVGSGGERLALLGDENGHTWFVLGNTEGACPGTTLEDQVAPAPAPNAGDFEVAVGGLCTAGQGLSGVPCYWVQGDETQIIDTNTATHITLLNPFTGAPGVGDDIYIGRIVAKLKTKEISLSRPKDKMTERYLHVYFEPNAAGKTLIVRYYENYGATAENSAQTVTDLTKGVDVTAASPDFEVDLANQEGYAKIPIGLDWNRTISVEFEVQQPLPRLLLLGYDIDGSSDEVERG